MIIFPSFLTGRIRLVFWVLTAFFFTAGLSGCAQKPEVEWERYTPEAWDEAVGAGQPVMAYFYAAWCGPCYLLKDHTFSDPGVIAALGPYRRFKVDMSFRQSPKVLEAGRRFGVSSLPQMLFLKPGEGLRDALRLKGFIPPEALLQSLRGYRRSISPGELQL